MKCLVLFIPFCSLEQVTLFCWCSVVNIDFTSNEPAKFGSQGYYKTKGN